MSIPPPAKRDGARRRDVAATVRMAWASFAAGKLDEAEASCRRALRAGEDPALLQILGLVLHRKGDGPQALRCLARAVELSPGRAECHVNLGTVLSALGRHEAALASLRAAIALDPHYADAWNNLGVALAGLGRTQEAGEAYRRAALEAPGSLDAHLNLASALQRGGRLRESLDAARHALELDPSAAAACEALALALEELGRAAEAVPWRRRAVERAPADAAVHSNLLYALLHVEGVTGEDLLAEHARWARAHGHAAAIAITTVAAAAPADASAAAPARPLRVGYVSADFREHTVPRFFEPLLAAHDPAAVTTICYSDLTREDAVTGRLRRRAALWRVTAHLSDAALAEMVRRDRVDVLVDLAGHMGRNRMPLFSLRPAPVQVAYLGYPHTTGLPQMDYRITDALSDPPGASDAEHLERLIRLPRCPWAYQPDADAPGVTELPALRAGRVTFGSFNRLAKLGRTTLRCWADVLRGVPGSRLLVLGPREGVDDVRDRLVGLGVAGETVECLDRGPRGLFIRYIHQIDVALDAFPYNGMTTTCDLLWMGVPVVSLCGRRHASRVGASLLGAVGLGELVADSPEEYVKIAASLAADLPRLGALRAGLRERFEASPLRDGPGLARMIEAAYRDAWLREAEAART